MNTSFDIWPRWLPSGDARRYVGAKSPKTWSKHFRPRLTTHKMPGGEIYYDRTEIDRVMASLSEDAITPEEKKEVDRIVGALAK